MAEFSEKQFHSIAQATGRQNIWVGSVRSGKSHAAMVAFCNFIVECPNRAFLLAGKSERTVRQNLIEPLSRWLGPDFYYVQGSGRVQMWDRYGYVVGANDERAEQKIRGSTFIAALLDEITILPESFYKMLLSRLSIEGAQLFGTTNPDSPFHWLKKDFIDRAEDLNIKVFNFKLTDNPSLSDSYIQALQQEYTGLWYKRYVEGLWVQAEGAVYDHFDDKINVIEYIPNNAIRYIVGVDYGTTNPCSFVLIGHRPNHFPNIWLEKEYYWNSKDKGRQKTDSEYADDFIDFIDGKHVSHIYIDPSAASFKQELRRRGVTGIYDADNDVLPGIRFVSQLLLDGSYKICSQCTHSIQEYHTYVWDESASKRGEDRPMKVNDHALDSQRYALYSYFFTKYGKTGMTEQEAEELERKFR